MESRDNFRKAENCRNTLEAISKNVKNIKLYR